MRPQDEKTERRPSSRKRPVFDCRAGMVKAAVWENEGAKGPFPTATFSRLYKREGDRWQSTAGFNVWDLADLARCAFSAEAYMRQHYGPDDEEAGDEGRRAAGRERR